MSLFSKLLSALTPTVSTQVGDTIADAALSNPNGARWDKLVQLADSKGIDVIPLGNDFNNAVSIGGIGDVAKKINIGGQQLLARDGDILVGGNYMKDFILAHELGHSISRMESGKMYNKLVQLSKAMDPASSKLPYMLENIASKKGKLAAIGLDAASKLPKLYEEYAASAKGRDLLKQVGANADEASKAFSGLGSYVAQDLGKDVLLAGITKFLK